MWTLIIGILGDLLKVILPRYFAHDPVKDVLKQVEDANVEASKVDRLPDGAAVDELHSKWQR